MCARAVHGSAFRKLKLHSEGGRLDPHLMQRMSLGLHDMEDHGGAVGVFLILDANIGKASGSPQFLYIFIETVSVSYGWPTCVASSTCASVPWTANRLHYFSGSRTSYKEIGKTNKTHIAAVVQTAGRTARIEIYCKLKAYNESPAPTTTYCRPSSR